MPRCALSTCCFSFVLQKRQRLISNWGGRKVIPVLADRDLSQQAKTKELVLGRRGISRQSEHIGEFEEYLVGAGVCSELASDSLNMIICLSAPVRHDCLCCLRRSCLQMLNVV